MTITTTAADPGPWVDHRPRCERRLCGTVLADHVARPWEIECPACNHINVADWP